MRRREHELAVTDLVDHDAPDDDAEAKSREAGTIDQAKFGLRKLEIGSPVIKDTTTDSKADACGQDRQEATQ